MMILKIGYKNKRLQKIEAFVLLLYVKCMVTGYCKIKLDLFFFLSLLGIMTAQNCNSCCNFKMMSRIANLRHRILITA